MRQIGLVRTSTAALVAFGFAFSGAASRFIDRQDLIVKEANALGTAYLRADTIAEPQRGELKTALKEYTTDRLTLHGSAADKRGHRSTLGAPRHVAKTSANSDHGDALGTAAIGIGMIGFGNGRLGRRFSVLDAVYGAALAAALWMTIDLDYPGIGLIRVSNLPVVEALAAMK